MWGDLLLGVGKCCFFRKNNPARLSSDTRTGKNYPAYYTAAGIPCFTRSCSSARLALLKRSSVPTR